MLLNQPSNDWLINRSSTLDWVTTNLSTDISIQASYIAVHWNSIGRPIYWSIHCPIYWLIVDWCTWQSGGEVSVKCCWNHANYIGQYYIHVSVAIYAHWVLIKYQTMMKYWLIHWLISQSRLTISRGRFRIFLRRGCTPKKWRHWLVSMR